VTTIALGIVGWSAFGLAIFVGLLLDLIGLFGNWIILAAVALAWLLTGNAYFGIWGFVILTVLAILGEVVEAIAAGYGAKKFGGGGKSMIAAIVGCIGGAIVFTPLIPIPLVGTLIGAIVGSFAGASLVEYLIENRHHSEAVKVGFGAALGKVAGVFGKMLTGCAMVAVIMSDILYF
jgi:uncharacterized protein YqgC (DUF456 family)